MAVDNSVTPAQWLAKQIETDDPDLLRSMVKTMAEALMSAQADNLCGAAYGERSDERTNSRNGTSPSRQGDFSRHDEQPAPSPPIPVHDPARNQWSEPTFLVCST
jgi:hypothetical protein